MTTAAFVLAVLSLCFSAFALGWQVLLYLLTSARVKVTTGGAVIVGPMASPRLYTITAANIGRAPTTVQGFGYALPDGKILVSPNPYPGSSSLPARLEPGTEVGQFLLADSIDAECAQRGITIEHLRPFARLAGSRTIKGKVIKRDQTL